MVIKLNFSLNFISFYRRIFFDELLILIYSCETLAFFAGQFYKFSVQPQLGAFFGGSLVYYGIVFDKVELFFCTEILFLRYFLVYIFFGVV